MPGGYSVIVADMNHDGHPDVLGMTQQVNELAESLTGRYGVRTLPAAMDVTDPDAVDRVVMHAEQHLGTVDLLVNNAATIERRAVPFWESEREDVWRVVSDPTRLPDWWPGVTRVERATALAWTTVLQAAKGKAVRADYTRVAADEPSTISWSQELEGTPVQVCALSPGIVLTDMILGEGITDPQEQQRSRKLYNVLADRVETVTPFLVEGILQTKRGGARVAWLTPGKAMLRFLTAPFIKRDLFSGPTAS